MTVETFPVKAATSSSFACSSDCYYNPIIAVTTAPTMLVETVEAACSVLLDGGANSGGSNHQSLHFCPLFPLDEQETYVFLSMLTQRKGLDSLVLDSVHLYSPSAYRQLYRYCFGNPGGPHKLHLENMQYYPTTCTTINANLTKLTINHSSGLDLADLAETICLQVPNLVELDLSYNSLSASTVKDGLSCLLATNNSTDASLDANASKRERKGLARLNLSNNQICKEGAITLAECMYRNTELEHLDLSSNCIGNEGLAAVLSAARESVIQTLVLEDNGITRINVVNCIPSLKSLNLGWNRLDSSSMAALSRICVQSNLSTLTLDFCEIRDQDLLLFCQHIQSNNMLQLRRLSIDGNCLTDCSAKNIATFLLQSSISNISMRLNMFTRLGVETVLDTLFNMQSLEHLDIDVYDTKQESKLYDLLRWNKVKQKRLQLLQSSRHEIPDLLFAITSQACNDDTMYQVLRGVPELVSCQSK